MGVVERSREVMAVMALHEALRNVCVNSDWTYSVFWTIRPRPRLRGGLGCKAGDEGSLMLMWEDGYCRPAGACSADAGQTQETEALVSNLHRVPSSMNLGDDVEEEDPVRKAFRKMSIQLYNYGEGLMGKVASDKCHKWVFRESSDNETGPLNYWQSSFDSHPPEWMDQFSAGIQTIAVIQAGHGLLQLGSCKIVAEDLHFVLRMRYTFESLENQAGGGFLSQTFAPMRNRFFCSSPTGAASAQNVATPGWQNTSPYFQSAGSSEFRLRLGLSGDLGQPEDNNITSLRLSLQNGSERFEFQNGEQSPAFAPGMKRPASSGNTDILMGKSSLLSRRTHFNKNGHPTFQELLQAGSPAAYPSGVFLAGNNNNNNVGGGVTGTDHDGLMVQIPPVFPNHSTSANHTPLVSPVGGSNKIQRTNSSMSPMIQSALQEAIERASRSNCSSPLPLRVHKQADHSFVTPKQELGTPKDNHSNGACFVTPNATAVDGDGTTSKVQVSTAATVWEETLELPPPSSNNSNRRAASGEMYPDFMDGFFE